MGEAKKAFEWWEMDGEPSEEERRRAEEAAAEDEQHFAAAYTLLPAWFIPRMMGDEWSFAFLLATGQTLHLTHIDRVRQAADGSIWLDVELLAGEVPYSVPRNRLGQLEPGHILAPTSRVTASVNAAHVVLAYETADT